MFLLLVFAKLSHIFKEPLCVVEREAEPVYFKKLWNLRHESCTFPSQKHKCSKFMDLCRGGRCLSVACY